MVKKEKVKGWVNSLAQSQGFYGRLYEHLTNECLWDDFVDMLNEHDVKDMLDMILIVEE